MTDRALIAARREIAVTRALVEIHTFRPCRRPVVAPEPPLPITDEEVQAWVNEHPFLRGHLAPHVARSLAFIDRWKRKPP